MTPQRWSQIKEVFFAAREMRAEARNAYLDSACRNDRKLRREIELLLDKDNGPSLRRPAENFLESLVSELAPGQVLAHYRVETKLGEGGMGAVYRAYDTRLRREVALKVLPLDRLADPESKRRLLREAQAAAALNHPNIVTVHEIGSHGGVDFIALESIQGKSLEELIPAKGLPIEKAIDYAVQIAGALAKAHAAGIIHRDLKPGNIMVTPDGLVKILDFGLAKLTQPARRDISETRSSKEEKAATEEGTILGTVAYMSPEQAEGKPVDARSDIFSFGSVLYEMTTGHRAFHGDTKLSTLSAILKEEPKAVSTVVPDVPRELEKIISRCMRKVPERRLQHMDDVKTLLDELKEESDSGKLEPATVGARSRRKPPLLLALVVAAVLVAAGAGLWLLRSTSPPVLTSAPLTSYPGQQTDPAFSPDGKQVAFAWDGEQGGNFDIYVKLVDAGAPLRLTSNPADEYAPAWSPDGRYIAFCRDVAHRGASIAFQMRPVEIWMVPALGGAERKLGEAATCGGLSWSPDGRFLALVERNPPQAPAAIFLLTIETGEKRRLTTPPKGFDADSVPRFSPDGKTLAFIRAPTSPSADIYVLPIRNNERSVIEPRRLTFRKQNMSGLDWTADGRKIVFASDQGTNSSLWTVPASGGRVDHLDYAGENAHGLSLSRTGNRLVYEHSSWDSNIWRVPGPNSSEMNNNDPIRLIASTQMDKEPQFAPDGQRIAFSSTRSGNYEIWVCDHEGRNPFQLTSSNGPQHVGSPRWSPDSKWIAFDSNSKAGNGDIYIISANGGPPRTLTTGPSNNVRPSWSHDGKWIYFGSNRSGASQIWKEPAAGGAAVQVTRSGGEEAFESTDGKFVYWAKLSEEGIWRVPVGGGDETQVLDVSMENHWTLTPQGICFFDLSNPAGPALKLYSFATHRRTLLNQFSKGIRVDMVSTALSVSPDGRWLLYTQLDQAGSNLVVVENFH